MRAGIFLTVTIFFPFSYTCAWRTHCAGLSYTVRGINWPYTVGHTYEGCNIYMRYSIHRMKTRQGNRQGGEQINNHTCEQEINIDGLQRIHIWSHLTYGLYRYFISLGFMNPFAFIIGSFLCFTYQQQCDCMYFMRLITYRGTTLTHGVNIRLKRQWHGSGKCKSSQDVTKIEEV